MKRLAGLVVLLLAGCAAPPAATTGPAGVPSASPSASATVHVRDQSLLKLPLGTVVDFDAVTVAVLADEGQKSVEGRALWAIRVNTCVSPEYVRTPLLAGKWSASGEDALRVAAEDASSLYAYGGRSVDPGKCAEGLVYFASAKKPSKVWYMSLDGYVGWVVP